MISDMAVFGAQASAHGAPSTNMQPVQRKASKKKEAEGQRKVVIEVLADRM